MSKIPESLVAEVVSEVSERMSDPTYPQVAIGTFAEAHPDAGRYITAHHEELGGGEGIMHTVFHAEVIHECFRRHVRRDISPVRFTALDRASGRDPSATLAKRQPAIADYIASNVDGDAMKRILSLVALAMDEFAR